MRRENAGNKMCPLLHGRAKTGYCEGAACMMWRWYQVYQSSNLSKEQGYCGLSGPQPGHRVYRTEESK